MTSGILKKIKTRPLLLLLAFFSQIAAATELNIADIMQTLAQRTSSRATFVELKYIAALQQPLESSGELFFTAPSRLEKHTIKPKSEILVLDGDKLQITRSNGRKMTLSLSDRPEASGFVESVRSTLLGDRAALERYYLLSAGGSMNQWQLQLTPKEEAMRKIISEIRVTGINAQIKTIEFRQADGDRSIMTITDEHAL
ncbi:MAG: LolA-related protein [Spongiibacteraceae bacterium]